MHQLQAYASRKEGVIYVTVSGFLSNSCYTARIADKYPGGNIVYVRDPGEAQVFVEEGVKPGSEICLMVLVPWVGHVKIVDDEHDKMSIFINDERALTVQIQDEAKNYRVIALTSAGTDPYMGCSVIPSDAPYLAIYSSVYGPASKGDCEKWVSENCTTPPDL